MKNKKAFETLLNAVEKAKSGSTFQSDQENYWKPERDAAGNGFAVIRFLPGKTDDDVPFVKMYNHGFKGDNGRWFIENCPTTIGKDCPACQANGKLWNSGVESDKEVARKRKRRLQYIANILVIQDSKNPENEGKVFLYKFGQKIFGKIEDKIAPTFEDEEPMNPFDPIDGANFKLKMRNVDGYPNYDKSEFDVASEIEYDEDSLYDLNELVSESNFKSYDDLQSKFATATGVEAAAPAPQVRKEEKEDAEFVKKVKASKPTAAPAATSDDEDESDLAYFASLAADED